MVLEKEGIRNQLYKSRQELSEFASTIREGKFKREIELVLEFLRNAGSDRFEEVFFGLNELDIMEWDYRFENLTALWHQEFIVFID